MEAISVLRKEEYFRAGENVHIQMSDEYPDYIGKKHTHEYIEVVYVISGSATHEIGDKVYKVKRGDLFIVNMNTPHVFKYDEDTEKPFVAYDLMFTPEFFDSSVSGYQSLEALNASFVFHSLFIDREQMPPYFSVSGSEYTAFGEIFNKIYLEYKGQKKGYIEIIRAYLIQLIITIFRIDDANVKNTSNIRNKQIVDFVINYINDNYTTNVSVSKLAKTVYLNQDYLGRIFKRMTGTTISAMVQKVRIEHACKLLSSTDKSVIDIASLCGFEDTKFFYTVFKKIMGVLPGDYRKNTHNK